MLFARYTDPSAPFAKGYKGDVPICFLVEQVISKRKGHSTARGILKRNSASDSIHTDRI